MVKYIVAASGGGTDFQSAVDAQKRGEIPKGEIVALFSNKEDAGALERAKKEGIPAYFIDHTFPNERDEAILELIDKTGAEFIFLAGYLKKISPKILARVPVYNIHPALDLKRFGGKGMYGLNVHREVIEAHVEFTGATIHRVDEIYDNGEILMQTPPVYVIPFESPEDLQKRVLAEEHKLIPKFLNNLTAELENKKSV